VAHQQHHRSPLSTSSSSSSSSSSSPLAHVLDVIRDLQEHEGWNENLLAEGEDGQDGYGVHGGDYGDWTTKDWAGEAMINSPRTLVVSVSPAFDHGSMAIVVVTDDAYICFGLGREPRER
jgi:hypothetical protein